MITVFLENLTNKNCLKSAVGIIALDGNWNDITVISVKSYSLEELATKESTSDQ